MKLYQGIVTCVVTSLCTLSYANKIELCVFDIMGSNGITMTVARDYALAAKQWGVDVQPKVYTQLNAAIKDFDSKKCDGVVADNFATRKYNVFMGTVGAVGAVPNYDIGQRVLMALGSSRLAPKLRNKTHEVVGYMPYGLVYLMAKTKEVDSLEKVRGLRIGVLEEDPSQRRMAQKVGMKPVLMTFDNAATKFRNDDFDIVPAPLIIWEAYEGEKLLGTNGGIADYPMAFMTMNFVLSVGNYPADFGQKSREWFSKQSPQMFRTVARWDAKVPAKYWIRIPDIDRPSYDHLASQLRKEFIDNNVYDASMMTLIRHLRCVQDSKFIECKK